MREAEPFGGKRFAEGFAERNETFPLGVNLPGFYPAVCPARPQGRTGLQLSDQTPLP
jgi:hypothetical protein